MHFISASCGGEKCRICKAPATHKVGEEIMPDDPNPVRHNLTAYVCCEHFRLIMGRRCDEKARLSDVLWEDLKIGMNVISAQGTPGKISQLLDDIHDRFPSIWINWENGKESLVFHHQADQVICL